MIFNNRARRCNLHNVITEVRTNEINVTCQLFPYGGRIVCGRKVTQLIDSSTVSIRLRQDAFLEAESV